MKRLESDAEAKHLLAHVEEELGLEQQNIFDNKNEIKQNQTTQL